MCQVRPASLNEGKVLDEKQDRIIEKGIKCLVADTGYRDKKRPTALAGNTRHAPNT